MTNLRVKEVEYVESRGEVPDNATLTEPLSERVIAAAISDVVARVDEGYVRDLVTVLQVRVRLAEDTGERLSLEDFATMEGYDLEQLRAE